MYANLKKMIHSHIGELAALLVAVFWTCSALAFESASKKVGSLPVNIIRLFVAFFFLCIFSFIVRGQFLPTDANAYQWFWLSLSGLVGFVMGDLFLFKAFTEIGSRMSMLMMTLAPPLTAFTGWLFLGEQITLWGIAGILLTVAGISIAIVSHNPEHERLRLNISVKGFLYGLGGATGQAFGLILSKKGMAGYNAYGATQIRIITGIVGFGILIILLKRLPQVWKALNHKSGMTGITIGAFFGPFMGVSLSLYSLKYTASGIADYHYVNYPYSDHSGCSDYI